MGRDEFINSQNNLSNFEQSDDNFFLQQEDENIPFNYISSNRRLNDYDSNILKEDAYKDISNELFKLEYKISKLENEIKILDSQIQAAKDINDYKTVEYLTNRGEQLINELKYISEMYKEKSLSAKISGGFFSKVKLPIKKFINSTKNNILSMLPNKFSSVSDLREALKKLENINKSVDDLMTMQTPYGEGEDKYQQLSKYIVKANTIQSQISKSLK